MELSILYEDREIIVCEKPAGVPSQSDRSQDMDMVSRLKNYLREQEPDKGVPYLAVVHRLDRPVGGVMVFAKTKQAAADLSKQIQNGQMKKKYLAVVCGDFSEQIGKEPVELTDYLKKDGKTNLAVLSTAKDAQAKKASLAYTIEQVAELLAPAKEEGKEKVSLVKVALFTGRHHQIRIQMATHLAPLWGDTKYNPVFANKKTKEFTPVALYAYQLSFLHPKTKKPLCFEKRPQAYPFSEFHVS